MYKSLFVPYLSCCIYFTYGRSGETPEKTCEDFPNKLIYDEWNCRPIYEKCSENKCPIAYDCKKLFNRPKSKCFLQGEYYEIGEKIENKDLVNVACPPECSCLKFNSKARISCVQSYASCVLRTESGCRNTYDDVYDCCSNTQICPPFSNLSTCNVNGNVYYEGETFNLSPRKTCICKCDSNELFCRENKCVTEYRFIKEIDERCAPVYGNFGNSPSCPSSWLCPNENDHYAPSNNKSDRKCEYGEKLLNIGDMVTYSDYSVYCAPIYSCKCEIPPLLSCQIYLRPCPPPPAEII